MRALALLLFAGCFGGVGGANYAPTRGAASIGVTDDDLYTATVSVFNDQGWDIREKDRGVGIVSTTFMEAGIGGGLSLAKILHSWRVRIADGELRIEIDCKMAEPSSGDLYPCGSQERKEEWIRGEPRLRKRILDDAAMRAAKRSHE